MTAPYPATIIVRHPREKPHKCFILPLRGRADLSFLQFPVSRPFDLSGYVRLAANGPFLSRADAESGILLLDGSWRWAEVMNRSYLDVLPRSLHGFVIVYLRVSKHS